MVDAIVSVVLQQLISVAVEETKGGVRLVTGVGTEVKRLQDNLEAIQAVLVDAERRQLEELPVRLWLEKLKEASYDMEDMLDEWNTARLKLQIEGVDDENCSLVPQKKVCNSFFPAVSCFGFRHIFLRRDIAIKMKAINREVDDIVKQKDLFNFNFNRHTDKLEKIQSTALIDLSEVRGRVEEKNALKSKLLCKSSEQTNAVQIISLVGMGGIGKTTLAQFAYNDEDVISNFEKRMWNCESIIEALEGFAPNLGELNSLLLRIDAFIARKKFLLILDDVWTDDYSKWEPFRRCLINGHRESRILVTTRKETVARMMESTDVIFIKELSEQECWALFKRFACFGRSLSECEQLEEIGKKIVGKCKGLPLAAKTIGSLLRFKRTREEWQSILDSEIWQLEEFEKGLLAPLLLSYNDLPTIIKQCFLYCAVFPKDCFLERDELIKLWMAQGYIVQKGNKEMEMEMIGEGYFDYLATRSFFQEFEKDEAGIVRRCKMHDIVHDFAQFLTKKEYAAVEIDGDEEPLSLINTSQEKLRHLMLVLGYKNSFPVSIFYARKLRSLMLSYNTLNQKASAQVLQGLFDQLTGLRVLRIEGMKSLIGSGTNEIPKGIKKLRHLRYLKLYLVEKLPETCCELLNLQTLNMCGSPGLKRLPQGIGKLINLRHLMFEVDYLEYMPKGIERLTSLRTLSEFVVVNGSGKYGSKACNLEGLRYLNHLRGSLKIRGLGNVTDIDEAKSAHLDKKKNLVVLILRFNKEAPVGMKDENEANHEAVCEALQPPPNLESLQITGFKGRTLMLSWIVSLNKLKKLRLLFCDKCEVMPALGILPSLEVLKIRFMKSVKRVGNEFLGTEISDHIHIQDGSMSSSSSSSANIAFPKLKELKFFCLDEWEEWDFGKEDITIMPQLSSMKISYCSKLNSLPDQLLQSTTLEELEIIRCPILEERFKKDTGEDWSKITHIPKIKIHGEYVQGSPPLLKSINSSFN
ncbi:hypothetical protein CISIN_1g002044mg [Citrus sinensis]|uniref:NB-ARC domain-containing protein n=3 Tax=Citrus TaxID=2706 RepID=A0A067EKH9_CITSI|nr:hypothetical protein CISIN_1g002044mg [Citrus sinensis]